MKATIWTCAQVLRKGVVPMESKPDDWEPGCGAACERNYDGRLECPTHGGLITCNMVTVELPEKGKPTLVQEAVALALVQVDEHYPIGDEYGNEYDPPESVFRSLEERGLVRIDMWVEGRDATEEAFGTSEGEAYLKRLVRQVGP